MWEISLREGSGLEEFVEGLKGVLKDRFVLLPSSIFLLGVKETDDNVWIDSI